jgi:hypothetical protein
MQEEEKRKSFGAREGSLAWQMLAVRLASVEFLLLCPMV